LLLRSPSIRRKGVERLGLDRWRGLDADPLFVFAPRLLAAPYIVFELANADRLLDPRIYVDHGRGFDPDEEIELRRTTGGVYVVALKSFGRVRRIRFDPSSYPSQFEFRAFVAYSERSVRAFVGKRLREAAKGERPVPSCEIVARGGDELAGLGLRATKIRSATQHFEQVIAMASQRFAAAEPIAGAEPLISFVCPIFDTPVDYLDALLDSFRIQKPGAWELVLVDDGSTSMETIARLDCLDATQSMRLIRSPSNGGIAAATNLGLAAARGAWVGFIDHDDALAPFAVDALVETIEKHPRAQFVYTDEIVADAKLEPKSYFLKPAFDPVLLSGVNYINHLSLYRRERLSRIGGLRAGFDGSQDYDLLLRYLAGATAEEIVHLPYPAYLWRRDGKSYSVHFLEGATANARRALAEAYTLEGETAAIEGALDDNLHRVLLPPPGGGWPTVSIVIPSRDAYSLLSRLLNDLTRRTDYPHVDIVIADNGSTDPRVLDLYDEMRAALPSFCAEIVEEPFNYARQANRGMRMARGDCILLLNNDVEVIDAGWLKEMVSCLAYPDTGVVGARLLYPNGTLQHGGVIVGLGSVAGHWFCGMPGEFRGPMGRLAVRQSLAAVTGACMLISRRCLEAVGDFDEENFAIAYNDIDFSLRAGRAGFRVVWTPFATLYHHESASRGSDETSANIERFRREQNALRAKYGLADYVDPAFNPWYSRDNGNPRLTLADRLPEGRHFRV
jgi:GT2 family glycosyltransferase